MNNNFFIKKKKKEVVVFRGAVNHTATNLIFTTVPLSIVCMNAFPECKNEESRSHVGSSNEHVAAAKLSPAHIASPFAAMRRRLKKKNQKIVDGKTIKDPAFKALF